MNRAAASQVAARRSTCPCGGLRDGLSDGLSSRPSGGSSNAAPLDYAACCARFIEQGLVPGSAEQLMRSRYTAYVLDDHAYLRDTWIPETCPADLSHQPHAVPQWLGLQVKAHREFDASHAEVEFVARYKVAGRAHRLHEISRFERAADGRWRYRDGTHPPEKR
jgi:SEC-C motif-containing protein